MARKDDNWFWDLMITFAGIYGIFWLLNKILAEPTGNVGIHGIPYARKLIPYIDNNGREIFKDELGSFESIEISEILNLIIKARQVDTLQMPLFKPFKNTKITAELRHDQFRIIVYRISEKDYLMLSIFKKKTNETPKSELDKAERRLAEYLNR